MEPPARHYRVLPTDDENNVLNTHKFIVYTSASPQKALQAAQKIPYHCAISDFRFPIAAARHGRRRIEIFDRSSHCAAQSADRKTFAGKYPEKTPAHQLK
ncbi:MAG TPA: hypothetical protein VGK14_14295 [Novimethylophilus sp.]|jgi:hypothetical protein|uniref:hypothetical protein n=1 Tax=Novimethylophilus sp. TaxID=2137426 RepID=UPI002F40C5A3